MPRSHSASFNPRKTPPGSHVLHVPLTERLQPGEAARRSWTKAGLVSLGSVGHSPQSRRAPGPPRCSGQMGRKQTIIDFDGVPVILFLCSQPCPGPVPEPPGPAGPCLSHLEALSVAETKQGGCLWPQGTPRQQRYRHGPMTLLSPRPSQAVGAPLPGCPPCTDKAQSRQLSDVLGSRTCCLFCASSQGGSTVVFPGAPSAHQDLETQ